MSEIIKFGPLVLSVISVLVSLIALRHSERSTERWLERMAQQYKDQEATTFSGDLTV